jgi:cyclohexa-1,5-dienecarbonyl-CoA hydratase
MRKGDDTMPVTVSVDTMQVRAAFRFSHQKGNILTREVMEALRSGLATAAQNPHLRLVTIQGDGDDFSFGASIPEHTPGEIRTALPLMHALIGDLLDTPAVTAAVVRGRCLGGGFELALACDLIFAAQSAAFGLPEIGLGVFPPAASVLLPCRIGTARAVVPLLTGEIRPASEWHADGVVHVVAADEALDAAVDEWYASHLATRSASALRHAASAARASLAAEVRATLPRLERLYLEDLMQSHDAVEGVEAFLQKRAPLWHDR